MGVIMQSVREARPTSDRSTSKPQFVADPFLQGYRTELYDRFDGDDIHHVIAVLSLTIALVNQLGGS